MEMKDILEKDFSGVISIVRKWEKRDQLSFGFADKANKIINEIDTKFPTASAGKVFVATAILHLIEKGDLQFDTFIGDVLKIDLMQIDPEITMRQLLNHTSGVPDYFDECVMSNYEALWVDVPNYRIRQSSDLIPLFINKPMLYRKGEKFKYNNTGYVLLGLVIEEITGKPFDEYLKEIIFEPCNMNDTGYYELDRLPAKCANAYIYDDNRKTFRTNIFSVDAKGTGAGGAYTTATDIEKFWAALVKGELINDELTNMMFSPQVKDGSYGYGVWLLNKKHPSFQGCDPGVNFITSYDYKLETIITILSNVEYDVESLHNKLSDCIRSGQ